MHNALSLVDLCTNPSMLLVIVLLAPPQHCHGLACRVFTWAHAPAQMWVCCADVYLAGIIIWGQYYAELAAALDGISVYFSATKTFGLGYACASNLPAPPTSLKPWTITCNSTLQNAQYITIVRPTTSAVRNLVITEVQPLRYGKLAPHNVGILCTRMDHQAPSLVLNVLELTSTP